MTAALCLAPVPAAQALLGFTTAPALPALPTLTLNGRAQILSAAMNNFGISDTLGGGWNMTVSGNTEAGKSPVFAQYCPNAGGCGSDAFGYVASGYKLPAGSLTLSSTGASFTTLLGGEASLLCSPTPCPLDGTTPSKIAAEASGVLVATWTTTGFSSSSVQVSTPTTLRVLPASEVYRVDVVWTLATGP